MSGWTTTYEVKGTWSKEAIEDIKNMKPFDPSVELTELDKWIKAEKRKMEINYLAYYEHIQEQYGAYCNELLERIQNDDITEKDLDDYAKHIDRNLNYREYVIEQIEKYDSVFKSFDFFNKQEFDFLKSEFKELNAYDTKLLESKADDFDKLITRYESMVNIQNKQIERNKKLKRIYEK